MTTKSEKRAIAEQLESALEAYEGAAPEDRLDFSKGSVGDVAHAAVRAGLTAVGNDPTDPQVLYSRGFIDKNDPQSWNRAVRKLIEELRS